MPFEASGFLPIPASLISTYRVGEWGLGTAILVPNALRVEDQSPFSTSVADGRLLLKNIKEELWLGASAARPLGDRVSLGISVFGVQSSESSITMFQVTPTGGETAQTVYDLQSR